MESNKLQRGVKRAISPREFSVLKFMKDQSTSLSECLTLEVTEIASGCGVRDTEEILRALYTLEGKNLVEPDPKGDFTSSQWKITDQGKKALELF